MRIAMTLVLALTTVPLAPWQRAKVEKIEKRLMAPCCYSQNIFDHMSDVAQQMRSQVTEMVADGESEQQIIDFYKAKYGDVILVVPDGFAGELAFGIPVAAFAIGFGLLVLVLSHFTRKPVMQQVSILEGRSDAEWLKMRKRIQAEIGEDV